MNKKCKYCGEVHEPVKPLPQPNIICWKCEGGGKLYRNPEFKEPYGYPYRSSEVECDICRGMGWIYMPAKT